MKKKRQIVQPKGQAKFYIGNRADSGIDRSGDQARIALKTGGKGYNGISGNSIYSLLNKFIITISTGGFNSCWVDIDARLQSNVETEDDKWQSFISHAYIRGWTGCNVINLNNGILTYGNAPSQQYGEIRFTFGANSAYHEQYSGLSILAIQGYGGMGWAAPSNFAQHGHLYPWDSYQNAIFPASITAEHFNGAANSIEWDEF